MKKNSKNKKVVVPGGLSDQVGAMIEHFDDKVTFMAEELSHVRKVVDRHTEILNHHSESIEIVKMNIEFIKASFKKKVDIEEFTSLEHRVSLLESRR